MTSIKEQLAARLIQLWDDSRKRVLLQIPKGMEATTFAQNVRNRIDQVKKDWATQSRWDDQGLTFGVTIDKENGCLVIIKRPKRAFGGANGTAMELSFLDEEGEVEGEEEAQDDADAPDEEEVEEPVVVPAKKATAKTAPSAPAKSSVAVAPAKKAPATVTKKRF